MSSAKQVPGPVPSGQALPTAAVDAIRQLLKNGRSRAALDHAKDLHKEYQSAASEELLLEAYGLRIAELAAQGLTVEAESLRALVAERHPNAAARLVIRTLDSALEELVRPLADADLPAGEREAVERRVMREVTDLARLAQCRALPADHPLRTGAAAVMVAFQRATGGPVSDEEVALPEVSRRSPLAPWKSIVRAIAHFHRKEDALAERHLAAVPEESAPAPMARALRGMWTAARPDSRSAAGRLAAEIQADRKALRDALRPLDAAFRRADEDRHILKLIRTAVAECQRSAPQILTTLRQHIAVRGDMLTMDPDQVTSAMGGPPKREALFECMRAVALGRSADEYDRMDAVTAWDEFRRLAVREQWFAEAGREEAFLYVHMAELLESIPPFDRSLDRFASPDEQPYYLDPDALYQRACEIDSCEEYFDKWFRWSRRERPGSSASVAEKWSLARPKDIMPVLFLMADAEDRRAYQKAAKYLAAAGQIDTVHPAVRRASLRLQLKTTLKHVEQRKYKLVRDGIRKLEELPSSRQGDRAAVAPGIRFLLATMENDPEAMRDAYRETGGILGSQFAASMLFSGFGAWAKRSVPLAILDMLPQQERDALPATIARVRALGDDCGTNFILPRVVTDDALRTLQKKRPKLDATQLRFLAEAALASGHQELAYAATTAGLALGEATEARFLMLRGQAIPEWNWHRRNRCVAAAMAMATEVRDTDLIDAIRRCNMDGPMEISPKLVAILRRKEKTAGDFPTRKSPGPDYTAQDETLNSPYDDDTPFDPFEAQEEVIGALDLLKPPPGMPRELFREFIQEMAQAIRDGESPEEFEQKMFGKPRRKKRK